MQNYSIGISGLSAAQKALDIIGNNIANAATEGYHRQRIELLPAYSIHSGSVQLGGGVDVAGVTRIIDRLLEQEILRQHSSLGQVSKELTTMHSVESAFGELSVSSGLNAAVDEFFNALQNLCAHPSEIVWQNQVVTAAQSLAGQFRTLGDFLYNLGTQIQLEAQDTVERINILITQIAKLNENIERTEISGGQANNLQDQRDQCIKELSELVGVELQQREFGVVDVSIVGIPVVVGTSAIELEIGLKENGLLGIAAAGTHNYITDVKGGKLGGLLSLKNELVREVRNELDLLAKSIIQQVNKYHTQGVGTDGSFTELTGWRMENENLIDFNQPVTNGVMCIRVINTGTGEIMRHQIDVDVSADSLTTIAAKISAVTGLNASVVSSKLHIQAEAGYKFDFLPAVLPGPTVSNLTAASPPVISVSGIYSGTENQTFTFTVVGTNSVGNSSLQLEVKDGAGAIVTTLNIGSGYAAGDKLDIGNGIKISVSTGDLVAGDTFEIEAFANSDTSGVLAAVGINTFFSGTCATNMAVCSYLVDSPGRIATALGADLTDNTNALRLSGLRNEAIADLNNMTVGEFYRKFITNIGQQVSIKQVRQDNIEIMIQNLNERQGEMSGVNINDEAAQILIFEQMFQAMAKYLNAVQSSMLTIMDMI